MLSFLCTKVTTILYTAVNTLKLKKISIEYLLFVLYDYLDTVKAAPHECLIRTGQP